jgi:hypothetical protein
MRDFKIKVLITIATFLFALVLLSVHALASTIREVRGGTDKLIPVHTALGFSTIIEFPSKPISSVLGDQDGIKLEYVGNSITLKPLIGGSHTNLFVYTEFDRFNFSIQTGSSSIVDYILKIKPLDEKKETAPFTSKAQDPFKIMLFNRKKTAFGFILKLLQLKINRDSNDPRAASLIEFELGSTKSTYDFQSASIGVKQNGKYLSVESLFLESTQVSPRSHPIRGVIAILNQEWNQKLPITLVFATRSNDLKSRTARLEVTVTSHVNKRKEVKNDKIELFPQLHR